MTNTDFRRRVIGIICVGLALCLITWVVSTILPQLTRGLTFLWFGWTCLFGINVYQRCKNAKIPGWWAVAIAVITLSIADMLFVFSFTGLIGYFDHVRHYALQTIVPLVATTLFLCWFDVRLERDFVKAKFRLMWATVSVSLAGVAFFNLTIASVLIQQSSLFGRWPVYLMTKTWPARLYINSLLPLRVEVALPIVLVCALICIVWANKQNTHSEKLI